MENITLRFRGSLFFLITFLDIQVLQFMFILCWNIRTYSTYYIINKKYLLLRKFVIVNNCWMLIQIIPCENVQLDYVINFWRLSCWPWHDMTWHSGHRHGRRPLPHRLRLLHESWSPSSPRKHNFVNTKNTQLWPQNCIPEIEYYPHMLRSDHRELRIS